MKSENRHFALHQAGFTLVEIMVGMVIGLLATIVIMKVLSTFEAQKRTTTGIADAQTNGNIALYDIERELQMAGYPLIPYGQPGIADSALECTTVTYGATGITGTSPVTIADGGTGSDTITIRYGDSLGGGIPTQIAATPIASAAFPPNAIDVPVGSSLGCSTADNALIFNGSSCALTSLHATSGVPDATTVRLVDNSAGGVAVSNANLSCLGTWNEVSYAVNGGNLNRTVRAKATATTTPMMAGIVNIQAQYGIAAAGVPSSAGNFNQVVQWVDATGIWAAPSVTNRNRIKAIRIAVVARNAKMETATVTDACSSRTAAAPTGLCAWDATSANPAVASPAPAIDLTADANWQKYRYRVFETIIPLRNVIWSKSTL